MSNARNLANLLGTNTQITTADIADGAFQANKNLIINGAMQIFQRGTSATNPGGGYDTVDRFRSSQNSGGLGNYNAEQSTDAPNGFGFSYKLTKSGSTTISSNLSAYIEQYIEGQNVQHLNYGSSSAVKLTASFHVKSSVTGTYGCFLGDGEAAKHNVQTFTISSANTWEKKTLTFNGDTATGLANDNSAELNLGIVLGAGSTYQTSDTNTWASGNKMSTSSQTQWVETDGATFFLTGVQLEVGEQATPFEHRSYGDELARCQRYFSVPITDVNHNGASNTVSSFGHGRGAGSGTVVVAQFIMPQPMRTSPTMTLGGSGGTVYVTDSNSRTSATPSSVQISQFCPGSTSALAAYTFGSAVCDDDRVCSIGAHTAVRITLDAEL
jgi:hypothetical protein